MKQLTSTKAIWTFGVALALLSTAACLYVKSYLRNENVNFDLFDEDGHDYL